MKRQHRRTLVQVLAALGQNAYIPGFFRGVIFQGNSKLLCVPGLNCYSCPGALGACPLGSLQAALGRRGRFPAYVLGSLLLFGVVLGRLVCGFLCPFGLLQDLLARVPLRKLRLPRWLDKPLRYLKYGLLLFLVIGALMEAAPLFCKFICPVGLLEAGLPLTLLDARLAALRGPLFWVKLGLLAAVLLISLLVERPFCKYLCPLGAFYGLFNGVGFYRMQVNAACIHCGKCQRACPMGIDVPHAPNSPECIRCGKCLDACPCGAIQAGISHTQRQATG